MRGWIRIPLICSQMMRDPTDAPDAAGGAERARVASEEWGAHLLALVHRLLGEQMSHGGWNCVAENGFTRGSFHTTIDVPEGLLEHEPATGSSPEVTAARRRGEEYLLERRMLRRQSTGEVVDPIPSSLPPSISSSAPKA